MRVALLHDVTRSVCQSGHHRAAAMWQAALAPAFAALGHELECPAMFAAERPEAVAALMRRAGLAPEPADWARLFSAPELLAEVEALVAPLEAELVLGWELSPNLVRALLRRGLPVIDMSLAPLRFAPDLFLRLRASRAAWAEALAAMEVPAQEVRQAAARMREAMAPEGGGRGDAVLFVGQTDLDASLIEGGRMAGVERHLGTLERMLAGGRRLLLKPHPHGERHEVVQLLHRRFPEAHIATRSVYALLSDPGIAGVATLSSSVAQEATWFGLPAVALATPDHAPERLPELSGFRVVKARVADPRFWDGVLGGAAVPEGGPALALRRMFRLDWGWPPMPPRAAVAPGPDWVELGRGQPGEALLGFGWGRPEADGVRPAGPLATLGFRRDAPGVAELACTVEAGADQPVALGVRPGGGGGRWVLRGGETCVLRVPVPAGEGIELALEGAVRVEAVRVV